MLRTKVRSATKVAKKQHTIAKKAVKKQHPHKSIAQRKTASYGKPSAKDSLIDTSGTPVLQPNGQPIAKLGLRHQSPIVSSPETFVKLEDQFKRIRGDNAIEILKRCRRDVKVIAIGGNQLTGKSTLCNNLMMKLTEDHYNYAVKYEKVPFHVSFLSAGQVFRSIAKMRGLEVGELSKLAKQNDDIDINIEYESCKGIMGGIAYTGRNVESLMNLILDEEGRGIGTIDQTPVDTKVNDDFSDSEELEFDMCNDKITVDPIKKLKKKQPKKFQFLPPKHPEHTVIVEGRNPAVMAAYCEAILGKENVTTIYLHCSVREQAVRYISREVGKDLAESIGQLLPNDEYKSLKQAGEDIGLLLTHIKDGTYQSLPFARQNAIIPEELKDVSINVEKVISQFALNESRDNDDKARYRATYDFPSELDYTSEYLYDVIIDTSAIQAEDTLAAVYQKLPKAVKELDYFYQNQTKL